jgi:NADH-quinone oxidoreductase subunit N
MMALFGLNGIPPTIGFAGKRLLFTATMTQDHFVLVLIAMVNVAISLYHCLMFLRAFYSLEPADDVPVFQETLLPLKVLSLSMILAIVARGIYPHHRNELT